MTLKKKTRQLPSSSIAQVGTSLLDHVCHELWCQRDVAASLEMLFCGLRELRRGADKADWQAFAMQCQDHPLISVIHQDPFTYRAFAKPRGYAGDATMLDFIYGVGESERILAESSDIGRSIATYTTNAPASKAVRTRRDLAARLIDEVADATPNARMMSVACGHLNEAGHSEAVKEGRIGRFVAFDQDASSLANVRTSFSKMQVDCVNGSVSNLIKREVPLEPFDLIYALGLYDYLPRVPAVTLTNSLFSLLRPGGRLLIGNFQPNIKDVGYMETFMAWKLIYRSPEEMAELAVGLDSAEAQCEVFVEENDNIAFLSVTRN